MCLPAWLISAFHFLPRLFQCTFEKALDGGLLCGAAIATAAAEASTVTTSAARAAVAAAVASALLP